MVCIRGQETELIQVYLLQWHKKKVWTDQDVFITGENVCIIASCNSQWERMRENKPNCDRNNDKGGRNAEWESISEITTNEWIIVNSCFRKTRSLKISRCCWDGADEPILGHVRVTKSLQKLSNNIKFAWNQVWKEAIGCC